MTLLPTSDRDGSQATDPVGHAHWPVATGFGAPQINSTVETSRCIPDSSRRCTPAVRNSSRSAIKAACTSTKPASSESFWKRPRSSREGSLRSRTNSSFWPDRVGSAKACWSAHWKPGSRGFHLTAQSRRAIRTAAPCFPNRKTGTIPAGFGRAWTRKNGTGRTDGTPSYGSTCPWCPARTPLPFKAPWISRWRTSPAAGRTGEFPGEPATCRPCHRATAIRQWL